MGPQRKLPGRTSDAVAARHDAEIAPGQRVGDEMKPHRNKESETVLPNRWQPRSQPTGGAGCDRSPPGVRTRRGPRRYRPSCCRALSKSKRIARRVSSLTMLCTQKNAATRTPRVTGMTRWTVPPLYKTMSPAGSFTRFSSSPSPITSSPPSYSAGSNRKRVADRSVRTRMGCPLWAARRHRYARRRSAHPRNG